MWGGNFLGELMSPVRALFSVQPSLGRVATSILKQEVINDPHGAYLDFSLCEYEQGSLPLSWSISLASRAEMASQLSGALAAEWGRQPRPIARYHEAAIAWLVDLLSGRGDGTQPPPEPPKGYVDCGSSYHAS